MSNNQPTWCKEFYLWSLTFKNSMIGNIKNFIYRILAPWRYLSIREKSTYFLWSNYLLPFILSMILLMSAGLASYIGVNDFKLNIPLEQLNSLIAILPGFFIAALAAIAVFPGDDINEPMNQSDNLQVLVLEQNQLAIKNVTRRHYLTMLFSFLCVQSFFISLTIVSFLYLFNKNFYSKMDSITIQLSIIFIVSFLIFRLAIVSLLGLYYISERIIIKQIK